jgi:hypothetical protein
LKFKQASQRVVAITQVSTSFRLGFPSPQVTRNPTFLNGAYTLLNSILGYRTLPKPQLIWNDHCQYPHPTWRRPGGRDEIDGAHPPPRRAHRPMPEDFTRLVAPRLKLC